MAKKPKPFNNPFAAAKKELKKKVREQSKAAFEAKVREPEPDPTPVDTDEALFMRAMRGAKPVGSDPRGLIDPPLPPPDASHVRIHDEEAETLAELASLVDGTGRFDISDSDEFIEGCVEGLDRRILRRLRRGDYSVQAHLDLHGLTRDPARVAVETFIAESRRATRRCVLIVHGRGLNSKDNIPVLKSLLKSWFERGRLARNILAFCSARPHDGGAGAVYVLLRR